MAHTGIHILSGFLGSGKTTLLQRILEEEYQRGRKVGVIMNEAGELPIDTQSLPEGTPLKELLNGCVCCTLSDKLETQISDILYHHDLDVLYIETTGVAHPVEVLDACLTPLLSDKVKVNSIITMVDPNSWAGRHNLRIPLRKLITEQVKHADLVILNKSDQLTIRNKEKLMRELNEINPGGKVLAAKHAQVPRDTFSNIEGQQRREHEKEQTIDHLHIKTYVHTFSSPVNKERFENFLKSMPEQIYRIKGYLRLTGQPGTQLFQYAYGMPSFTPSPLNLENNLVFIGDDLDHAALNEELREVEEKSSPSHSSTQD